MVHKFTRMRLKFITFACQQAIVWLYRDCILMQSANVSTFSLRGASENVKCYSKASASMKFLDKKRYDPLSPGEGL